MIGQKDVKKVHGGLVLVDNQGNVEEVSYEEVLVQWLKQNTPPAVDTDQICEELDFSYDTVQPKLKQLAEENEHVRITKKERAVGQIGRRKYLWYYE